LLPLAKNDPAHELRMKF